MTLDWEEFRRSNRSINLTEAWKAKNGGEIPSQCGYVFLQLVEEYQPIVSRQVAAIALAHASVIGVEIA
jgi:hypothetical protein